MKVSIRWTFLHHIEAYARASSIKVEIYLDMKGSRLTFCITFKEKHVFCAPSLTKHTKNILHSITYHENNVQAQSEHTQSLRHIKH